MKKWAAVMVLMKQPFFFTEERLFRNKKHKIGSDHFLVPEIFFIALCGQVEDSVVLT